MKFFLNMVREGENLIIPHCIGQGCLNFTLKHQFPVPAGARCSISWTTRLIQYKNLILIFLRQVVWCKV